LTKVALSSGGANPLVLSLIRDSLAYPILQGWAVPVDGFHLPQREDVHRIALLGLTGMFGNQFMYILGLDLSNSTAAAIMNQAQPIIATSLAIAVGLEAFRWTKLVGILLATVGSAVMIGLFSVLDIPSVRIITGSKHDDEAGGSMGLAGALCVIGSCLCMSLYYILQKPLLAKYSVLSLTAWSYLFGALWMGLGAAIMALAGVCFKEKKDSDAAMGCVAHPAAWTINQDTAIALAFAVVCNSVLKYAFQSFCNKYLEVSILTAAGTLVAFMTCAMDIFFLGSSLFLSEIVGCAMIFAGLWIITAQKGAERRNGATPETIDKQRLLDPASTASPAAARLNV